MAAKIDFLVLWISLIAPLLLSVDNLGPISDTINSTVSAEWIEKIKNAQRIPGLEAVLWTPPPSHHLKLVNMSL